MPYMEVDAEGNPVEIEGEDGEMTKNIIEDIGSWDQVKGQIPEDLQEEKMWANVKDVPGLLKSYAHAQKSMGGAVKVPADDADETEWNEFYEKIGRPETPDGYDIEWPERENVDWDPDLQQQFGKLAHDIGLNKKQVKALVAFEDGRIGEIADTGSKAIKAAEDHLKDEWGGNFTRNVAYAQRAVGHIGGDELKTVLDDTGLGNNPVIAKAMYKIGRMMVEDGIIPGEVQGATTKADALSKISEVMADSAHPYHTGDMDAVKMMQQLHQIAYNE